MHFIHILSKWASSVAAPFSQLKGTCCSDGFHHAAHSLLRKKFFFYVDFAPATCCINFSWFKFACHKIRTNDLDILCRIVSTAIASCSRKNVDTNQYPLRVHAPASARTARATFVQTKGHVTVLLPVTCPIVCTNLYSVYVRHCFNQLSR